MIELTTEAVSQALLGAGFREAETDSFTNVIGEGFTTHVVPVSHEDRVGVCWNVIVNGLDDRRYHETAALGDCVAALEAAGYQAEIMAELIGPTLIVWVEGDF